ncbi:hypothetical protein A2899_00575 [Candidatus Amesbacteria bacterium RIFCSPLOWO2_01_FULL_49_25]|uniref:DUF304 domain-containing protein n=1 Tax=Candidatus Amesbacteria bacterium RIFCSPHIGHO2_01_FULL_48_32b TaxID=1797253 RepID=A0A1F4YIR9_9BACT|nr:MAG: hypothetical protein A2876_01185 [Candidatus Amesbacteria bacterium RIFCSPHIGHO2_01_FULL_48_32b]OGD08009.1 MAG: hypothetical protein A2899_00575 [Candidatus Amesbacteria bacterium RIFCSPLOWO2_01_FULL_49_25]
MPDIYQAMEEGRIEEPPRPREKLAQKYDPKPMIKQVLEKCGEWPRQAMMGAYCVAPGKRFINEQEDEEIVLLLRAHPITTIKWLFWAGILLIVPVAFEATGIFGSWPAGVVLVGKMQWYLMVFAFIIHEFLKWYYSVFIVTNERVVDIDFVNFLTRVVSYTNLNHIEEPSMVAGGLFKSIFRYGDVFVATAAEGQTTEGRGVPYPNQVIRIISELSEELEIRRERGE